jgi:abortive infection bacteriophage resistance protein
VASPKQWLSFEDQAQKMLDRGMIGDRAVIVERLRHCNYYRLLGYSHPFRLRGDPADRFVPGLHFEAIWEDYVFDQKLRVLMIEAIERIEVAVRTQIAHHHARVFGPLGYATNAASLPKLRNGHTNFLRHIAKGLVDCRDQQFMRRFLRKNGLPDKERQPSWPPPWPELWITCETMTLGSVLEMYRGCRDQEREVIARELKLTSGVLGHWLEMYWMIRNFCAHHARLWNRALAVSARNPPMHLHPDWYSPINVGSSPNMFGALSATVIMLRIVAPDSTWGDRVKGLFNTHPGVPLAEMGFPKDWESSALWS